MIIVGIDPGKHLGLVAIGDTSAALAELVDHHTIEVDDTPIGREEAAVAAVAWARENSGEVIAIEWVDDLWGNPRAHTHVMRAQSLAALIGREARVAGLPVVVLHRQRALALVRRLALLVPGCPAVPGVVERGTAQLEAPLGALVVGWAERTRAPVVGQVGRAEHEADACAVALAESAQRHGIALPAKAKRPQSKAARRARRREAEDQPRRPPRDFHAEEKAARAAVRVAAGCQCGSGAHRKVCSLWKRAAPWNTRRVRLERGMGT